MGFSEGIAGLGGGQIPDTLPPLLVQRIADDKLFKRTDHDEIFHR